MKEDASNKEKYILTSVDNTLSLLNLFFDYEELSVNDAAKLLGLSRSTVFRFMVTLENRGFLSKTDHATYRLGLNMFSLGMLAYNRMELAALIHPYLQDIARQTGETSHLGIVDDGIHIMFIDRALGTSQLKMETALGYRQLAHHTASGKAILGFQSDQVIREYIKRVSFQKLTPASLGNAGELLRLLDQVKREGYACDNEESELGLTCFAVPIVDATGRAVASISISGPTTRMKTHKKSHIVLLKHTVDELSRTLR